MGSDSACTAAPSFRLLSPRARFRRPTIRLRRGQAPPTAQQTNVPIPAWTPTAIPPQQGSCPGSGYDYGCNNTIIADWDEVQWQLDVPSGVIFGSVSRPSIHRACSTSRSRLMAGPSSTQTTRSALLVTTNIAPLRQQLLWQTARTNGGLIACPNDGYCRVLQSAQAATATGSTAALISAPAHGQYVGKPVRITGSTDSTLVDGPYCILQYKSDR